MSSLRAAALLSLIVSAADPASAGAQVQREVSGELPAQSDAPGVTLSSGPQLGREQGNIWMPLDVLRGRTPEERRGAMIERIREEVAARQSSIDTKKLDDTLAAMATIDREDFVPDEVRRQAYLPLSLAIGHGQTISDAYIVAVMTVAARIRPGMKVLEVGTGSGFQAALLARLGARVITIEIVPELAREARERLARLGYRDVEVRQGDGGFGASDAAPFDAILVTAGGTALPPALMRQLTPGGTLIAPVGPTQLKEQLLVATRDSHGAVHTCSLGAAAFVPLTGSSPRGEPGLASTAMRGSYCYGRPVT